MNTISTLDNGLVVDFSPLATKVSDDELAELCRLNPELQFERTSEGELVVMSPTGGKTSLRNAWLIAQVMNWAEKDRTGLVFDSSALFTLANTAKRSPDVAWVNNERWNRLSLKEQDEFPPVCPDFVVELRSRTDRLTPLKDKMQEYIDNGAQLGWLIDPQERKIHVYRPGIPPEVLDNPQTISGEALLKNFVLEVRTLWD
jgi:Uma2 family endonuclease